jgi:predicted MFS family arabinose efflux permease
LVEHAHVDVADQGQPGHQANDTCGLGAVLHSAPPPRAALLYAVAMLGTALTSQTYLAIVLLIVVGVVSITFLTTGNSTIQIAARPDMRGRVTALWSTALVGSTPIGATIMGAVGDSAPRFALILGGGACAAAAALGAAILKCARTRSPAAGDDNSPR